MDKIITVIRIEQRVDKLNREELTEAYKEAYIEDTRGMIISEIDPGTDTDVDVTVEIERGPAIKRLRYKGTDIAHHNFQFEVGKIYETTEEVAEDDDYLSIINEENDSHMFSLLPDPSGYSYKTWFEEVE